MEKLKFMPYAQAHIVRNGQAVVLVSYRTACVMINNGILTCNGLYSRTTIRHISAFCRQFNTSYSIAKKCYQEGVAYNLNTKQFVSLD
jgi:hypothetical protein